MKKHLYKLLALAAVLIACDPDDPDFKSVNATSIDSVYVNMSGASAAYATGIPTNIYTYSMTSVGNATYKWEVKGHGATITVLDKNYGGVVDIVFKQSDVNTASTVVCTVTTDYGVSETRSIDVSLSAYCAYDTKGIDGTVFSTDELDLVYGVDYGSVATFTYDAATSTITAEDLSVLWMEDAWAETITSQIPVTIHVDDLGLNMTIDEQLYLSTLYDGAPYTYNILGDGVIDGCTNTFTLDWELYSNENDYSLYFRIVGTLP